MTGVSRSELMVLIVVGSRANRRPGVGLQAQPPRDERAQPELTAVETASSESSKLAGQALA
jgi:hypothetical protein